MRPVSIVLGSQFLCRNVPLSVLNVMFWCFELLRDRQTCTKKTQTPISAWITWEGTERICFMNPLQHDPTHVQATAQMLWTSPSQSAEVCNRSPLRFLQCTAVTSVSHFLSSPRPAASAKNSAHHSQPSAFFYFSRPFRVRWAGCGFGRANRFCTV